MIVLDTHALLWYLSDQKRLSAKARKAINQHSQQIGMLLVSSISVWEISMLVQKGRLALTVDLDSWIGQLEKVPAVRFQPISNKIALTSTHLPGEFHKDPADRMIVATARINACSLVTADEKIRAYPHVESIW